MRVCHGVAGLVVEVDEAELQWKKPVDLAKQHALERWQMPASDVIALTSGGGTVGPSLTADALGGRDVFLFLRTALDPREEVPPEPLALEEAGEASAPAGAAAEDELLRLRAECADPAFEAFRSNIEEAQRWLLESRPVGALAARLAARQEVQRAAAQAVLENLTTHRATCSRSMALFLQKYSKVQERFDQNLDNVEPSLAALASVQLHPSLRAPGRASLADLVPRERVAHFTANLQAERKRLTQRLEKLKQQDASVQSLCEQVKEHMLQFLQEDGVAGVAEKVREEHARAEREVLPELRGLVPREGAAPPSVLEEEKRSAEALEGLARLCGDLRARRLPELQERWEQRQRQFLQKLREVSYVQSKVRDVERQAALFEEEVNVQRNYSQQLGHLKKMPRAYQKMLHEVARRRQFRERYLAEREQARLRLARMAEEENVRRRAFLQRHGCHLPAELAQGLGTLVPPVTVDVAAFDAQLPDIDFSTMLDTSAAAPPSGIAAASAVAGEGSPGPSRERASSTSSCGSSSLQPWAARVGSTNSSGGRSQPTPRPGGPGPEPLGGSLLGGSHSSGQAGSSGQGGSSGPAGSSGQAASLLACSQDGGGGTGSSQSGTAETAADAAKVALAVQNHELKAQVAALMEELAQLRAAQPSAAAPASSSAQSPPSPAADGPPT